MLRNGALQKVVVRGPRFSGCVGTQIFSARPCTWLIVHDHSFAGVIFYGTPHKGSPLANFGNNFFYVFFPTIEVQELSYDNREYLDGLNAHFANLVDKGMQCLSFAELKVSFLVSTIRRRTDLDWHHKSIVLTSGVANCSLHPLRPVRLLRCADRLCQSRLRQICPSCHRPFARVQAKL